MKLPQAISFFENLLKNVSSKSETKIVQAFLKVLNNLNERTWEMHDLAKIEQKIDALKLDAVQVKRNKHLRKKHQEFTTFLKNEFDLITTGYYTTLGMVFGMIFGQGLGLALGVAFAGTTGLAIGLSLGTGMGMGLGIALGAVKEAEAKKQGKVLG